MHSGPMEVVEREPRMSDHRRAFARLIYAYRKSGFKAIARSKSATALDDLSVRHVDDTTAVVGLRVVGPQFDRRV